MTIPASTFTALADADLLDEVVRLATCERHATVQLIASLAELDARRLYLGQGCSSMFTYCTQVLHLSEHAAYNRIEAARAARRFPVILERLAEGSITLTTVCLLAAHLTPENHREVLDAARYRSKREVEVLMASLRRLPPVPSAVRKLPTRPAVPSPVAQVASMRASDPPLLGPEPVARTTPLGRTTMPAPTDPRASGSALVAPLTPDRYKLQVTVGCETIGTLRRVQDLMRHAVPDGNPAIIIDRALTVLLAQLERTKMGSTQRPRKGRELILGSRHVPATVRRAVWARDGRQCAFIGADGRRCQERGLLELHHTVPYAAGGEATVEMIELRCRAHNLYEAELDFGPAIRDRQHVQRDVGTTASP